MERVRNANLGPRTGTLKESTHGSCGSTGPTIIASDIPEFEITRSIADTVTPGYDDLIAKGAIINNNCTMSFSELLSEGQGYATGKKHTDQDCYYTWIGLLTEYFGTPVDVLTAPDELPAVKLAALSRMDSSAFAFGEDIGEIGQTIRFLKNPISSVVSTLTDLTRSKYTKIRKGVSVAKATADTYASYQWALKPLVRSATDLTVALTSQVAQLQPRYTSRGKKIFEDKTSHQYSHTISPGLTGLGTCNETLMQTSSAYILYKNISQDNPTLRKYGLRLKDAPETAWQLFPLSFMIDRVANISHAISAIGNILNSDLTVLAAGTVIRTEREKSYKLDSFSHPDWAPSTTAELVTRKKFTYERRTWTPSMIDVIPPITPGYIVKDLSSILDLTALATQRLTGLYKP